MADGQQNDQRFRDQYISFLKEIKIELRGKLIQGAGSETQKAAEKMLEEVFGPLLKPKGVDRVVKDASNLIPSVRAALVSELEYLTTKWGEEGFDAAEAKTAKDSLHKLLKRWLPQWIQDLLDILNEILTIVAGRGDDQPAYGTVR